MTVSHKLPPDLEAILTGTPKPNADTGIGPTIRIVAGQIHKTATDAETALIRADAPFFPAAASLCAQSSKR
jgi:hypothetical protein